MFISADGVFYNDTFEYVCLFPIPANFQLNLITRNKVSRFADAEFFFRHIAVQEYDAGGRDDVGFLYNGNRLEIVGRVIHLAAVDMYFETGIVILPRCGYDPFISNYI